MSPGRSEAPELPPVDRFGAWLDRKHAARPWTDPHRFWAVVIAAVIAVPGFVLAKRGGAAMVLGALLVLVAAGMFAALLWRYQPAYRRRSR